jgi:ferrous iron transport protein B
VVVVAVADATNLRLVLRLILELKAVGRPMVLALNMYDIAQRQGLRIDLDGLARELGCPIVTTVATRKRGHRRPHGQGRRTGRLRRPWRAPTPWREAGRGEIRAAHREAQRS